jgi:hypothetical protein
MISDEILLNIPDNIVVIKKFQRQQKQVEEQPVSKFLLYYDRLNLFTERLEKSKNEMSFL